MPIVRLEESPRRQVGQAEVAGSRVQVVVRVDCEGVSGVLDVIRVDWEEG
jgi:hypothetical protein